MSSGFEDQFHSVVSRSGENLQFTVSGVSHRGNVREINEDRFYLNDRDHFWAVADGMGGHEGGDVASSLIVESLSSVGVPSSALDLGARVLQRLNDANEKIFTLSEERNGVIGSTVVALLTFDGAFSCLWCGDSRLYQIRDGEMVQVSTDHSEVVELLRQNVITKEEADNWPRKNVITRAIGVAPEAEIDSVFGKMTTGDTYVLCSDGLTAHLSDQEILDTVYGKRPQSACDSLLQTTLERGASDNVTIVVIQCQSENSTVPASNPIAASD